MSRKRLQRQPVPYSQPRPQGGWRLQFPDPESGKLVSARKLDPREPAFYATEDELRAGHVRLTEFVKQHYDRGDTVAGFCEEWTDHEHHRWGKGRSEQTMLTYRSGMRGFVQRFGKRKLASITVHDIDDYLATRPAQTNAVIVGMFFRDAVRAHKRPDDPTVEFDLNRPQVKQEPAPSPEMLDVLLKYAYSSERIPHSLYQWLLVGSETGMRTGELDAMHVDKLDLSDPERPLYRIDRQYHAKLRTYTKPKHVRDDEYGRTILLPPSVMPEIRRAAATAHERGGWLFTNPTTGTHWNADARKHYWQKIGGDSLRLRLATDEYPTGLSMKAATRVYFATRMVLLAPHRIPQIALHYGHRDKGVTLLKFYTRLTDRHGQDGMAEVYGAIPAPKPPIPADVINLDDRRKS